MVLIILASIYTSTVVLNSSYVSSDVVKIELINFHFVFLTLFAQLGLVDGAHCD